ncbi:polyprenyl synthetase family protein [Streptomyces sp. NPDC014891]|uniref:polyprenyl synthetase family protein n=1 Tax=Streptomyces sp. NPDC014891 TaxID=3364929 RepID=UPI0036F60FB8
MSAVSLSSPGVQALLVEARSRTDAVVAPLLERVDPEAAGVLAYQWGWRGTRGELVAGGGRGKAVRAALVFAAARATGDGPGSEDDPLVRAGAAAVEVLHTLSLLHDDVMDGDALRRGRPAAWKVFGADVVESAVRALTPDALELAFRDVLGVSGRPGIAPPRLAGAARATGLLGDALVRLAQGQALDLALEEEARCDTATILRVHADKTGSLFACACALGAAPEAAGDLAVFGENLGIAFQIVDDVLGLWGDPAVMGKPAGADLTARKKSYPVAVALSGEGTRHDVAGTGRLRELYARPEPWTLEQAGEVRRLLDGSGARGVAEAAARAHERRALDALARACPPSRKAGDDLRALAAFVTGRAY